MDTRKQVSVDRGARVETRLTRYPVNMSEFLMLHKYAKDEQGIPFLEYNAEYRPATITQYALAHWNAYIATRDESHCLTFLAQVRWLIEHVVYVDEAVCGWPSTFVYSQNCWFSATTQGTALSVLLRAYLITGVREYRTLAEHVFGTFERDILDGGISTSTGEDGLFFEEVAVYPATHGLLGELFALLSLFEYKNMMRPLEADTLLERAMAALHLYLDAYDTGYWATTDLLQHSLASPAELTLQIQLLRTLGQSASSMPCILSAERWHHYMQKSRMRYEMQNRWQQATNKFVQCVRAIVLPVQSQPMRVTKVCIALTAFPVTGGIRAVMAGIAKATAGIWEREYLTHFIGPNPQHLPIHTFGTKQTAAWQFPNLWFYVVFGCHKTLALLRQGSHYDVLLPQDGVYTALFTALAGKLAGIRVVCIDHGTLTLLKSATYRAERTQGMAEKHTSKVWLLVSLLRYHLYFPSVSLCAVLAVRLVDHFLIPGVAGDAIEASCKRLGIHPSRITRFGSMIESERHVVVDGAARETLRLQKDIPPNAVLVAMVCRLAPEKGIDIALEAIDIAYHALPIEKRTQLRVVIAGGGPLKASLEADIHRRGLSTTCLLWGEISPSDVLELLSISDIFLYASRRGACMSMAVLEAMASQCAVIASTEPVSNVHLLANGRGIALPTNEPQSMANALIRLISEREYGIEMGKTAREYISTHHSVAIFRRTLLRATRWAALDEVIAKYKHTVEAISSCEGIS